jgi:hypothetical protein
MLTFVIASMVVTKARKNNEGECHDATDRS